ncbi:PAS domain-containing sensor histidine kinase [Deinococcus aquatilis]|uniref:PAS domain-containing sensor histidine kinase n=1 Tax=Deinococcus aquatilis TaxID=519440 RepID=UPI00037A15A0|nr:ATP-binding protein [Deinococcus aquatilis]
MSLPQTNDTRLQLALKAARQGAWEFDLRSNAGYRSPELRELLGVQQGDPSLTDYLAHVDPADRARVIRAFGELRSGERDESVLQYRFLRDDRQELWVEQHTFVERDELGEAVRLYGLSRDITAQKQTEQALHELNATLEARVTQRTRQLIEERAAQEAYVAFTEAVGTETDVLVLARQAIAMLQLRFPGGTVVYYAQQGELWQAQAWSEDISEELLATVVGGLPTSTPLIRSTLASENGFFTGQWNSEQIHHTEEYSAAAGYPLRVNGKVKHLMLFGLKAPNAWSDQDQALIRAVSRSLKLALERAEVVTELDRRTRDLERARRQAEVLAVLGEALQRTVTPDEVAALALARIGPAIQAQSMLVVRLEDDQIHLPTLWGDTPEAIMRYMTRPGLKLDEAPILQRVAQTGRSVYLDNYRSEPGTVASFPALAGAVEPIHLPDQTLGGFLVAWRQEECGAWLEHEQDLLRRAANTLGLALERAVQARHLQLNKAEVESRNAALEAVAQLSRDLMFETDRYPLVRRAQDIALSLVPSGYASYYEPEGDLWRLKSLAGEFGDPRLETLAQAGFPLAVPTLMTPWKTRQPFFQDMYQQGLDTSPEVVQHIHAVAALPLMMNEAPVGIVVVALFGQRTWTSVDRAVLETIVSGLGLAAERVEQARQLTAQRDALNLRTQALGAANEELEAFAYSVSHDLRTPVRHIASFNDLLRKSLGDNLDPKVGRYLGVIDQAARRMNTLIDAMLDLSRTSRQPLRLGLVDLGTLVASVQMEVSADVQDRQIEWKLGHLPLVMGDLELLRQVMLNLMSNAVKYTGPRPVAHIEVWAEERPQEWAVFVRDDGVGFDPRYGNKLFGVFQRLHRQEDFEGNGVGLANVRRILARHGGQVLAEGRLGAGATFSFTLPRPDTANNQGR